MNASGRPGLAKTVRTIHFCSRVGVLREQSHGYSVKGYRVRREVTAVIEQNKYLLNSHKSA